MATTAVPATRSHTTDTGVDIALTRATAGEWDGTFLLTVGALLEDLFSDDAPTRLQVLTCGERHSPPMTTTGTVFEVDGSELVFDDGQRVDLEDAVRVAVLG